jgi:hypothetical protein
MAADLERSIGRVLVMAHPFEIAVQQGVIDLLLRQGIQKPRVPKVGEETIDRVAHPTEVFFPHPSVPAPQRVGPEKALHFSQTDGLVDPTPRAAQMLVKVGYIKEVRTYCPATESMLQQPVAKPFQKLSYRTTAQPPQCSRILKNPFQCHDNLLSLPLL